MTAAIADAMLIDMGGDQTSARGRRRTWLLAVVTGPVVVLSAMAACDDSVTPVAVDAGASTDATAGNDASSDGAANVVADGASDAGVANDAADGGSTTYLPGTWVTPQSTGACAVPHTTVLASGFPSGQVSGRPIGEVAIAGAYVFWVDQGHLYRVLRDGSGSAESVATVGGISADISNELGAVGKFVFYANENTRLTILDSTTGQVTVPNTTIRGPVDDPTYGGELAAREHVSWTGDGAFYYLPVSGTFSAGYELIPPPIRVATDGAIARMGSLPYQPRALPGVSGGGFTYLPFASLDDAGAELKRADSNGNGAWISVPVKEDLVVDDVALYYRSGSTIVREPNDGGAASVAFDASTIDAGASFAFFVRDNRLLITTGRAVFIIGANGVATELLAARDVVLAGTRADAPTRFAHLVADGHDVAFATFTGCPSDVPDAGGVACDPQSSSIVISCLP